jgi:hypothetical protein
MIQPVRAKDNTPPFQRWVADWNRNESRQGRQNPVLFSGVFFRPSGAWEVFGRDYPAINRWAIFGRPCGTGTNGGVEK